MSGRLRILATFLSVVFLALAGLLARDFIPSAAAALAAVFWLIGLRWNRGWVNALALTGTVLAAAYSIIAGGAALLSLGALLSALAAWDLARFSPLLADLTPAAAVPPLESLHLRRLGLALGLGALVGLAALLVRFQLSFAAAAILTLAAFVILALGMNALAGEAKE